MSDFIRFVFVCIFFLSAIAQSESQDRITQSHVDAEHTEWIAKALMTIQTIKIGMTRADLMKVFTIEGGLSTTSQRTYVYQKCPYIKVDVKFSPTSRMKNARRTRLLKFLALTSLGQSWIEGRSLIHSHAL